MEDSWIGPAIRIAYFIVGANLFATHMARMFEVANKFAPTYPAPFPGVNANH
jgi:hypothetical protein